MRIRERIRSRVQQGLEHFGGTFLVKIKEQIIQFGCEHADEAIEKVHVAWVAFVNQMAAALPGDLETQIAEAIWVRIEAAARSFKDTVCVPAADGKFKSGNLMADHLVMAAAADPTLPD